MNFKLNKIFAILLLCELTKLSEQHCPDQKNNHKECGSYCYNIVKPLLKYVSTLKNKEQQYDDLLVKVRVLEMTIKHMESTIMEKDLQMEMQLELGQVYKEKSLISEDLIKQKNAQIKELQASLLETQSLKTVVKPVLNKEELVVKDKLIKLERHPKMNENLWASTDKSRTNEEQSNMLISEITKVNSNSSAEVIKHQETEYYFDKYLAKNCIGKLSDIYMFKVPGIEHFALPCDSTLAGSGWTVIQRRQDGTENFNRNWTDYQMGFGDLRKEFFIGLEKLHLITNSQPHELYVHLEDFNKETRYAQYNHFVIGNVNESYAIKSLGEYSGNAENALLSHKNMKFLTPDRYFDSEFNCAENYKSGCNLNGPYINQNVENSNAIEWRTWHFKPLKFVQMMIRPNQIK